MIWLIVRIVAFAGWAVILCLIGALLTLPFAFNQLDIDDAYEREVDSIRMVSLGIDPLRRLPQERRAQQVGGWINAKLSEITRFQPGANRTSSGFGDALAHLPMGWWDRLKPKLVRFAPVVWIRLETYLTIYTSCIPLYFCAFLFGEHLARLKIRAGVHKRNVFPIWIRRFLWSIRDLSIVCMGVVLFAPVVWWVIPSILISCALLVLWRAYSIQGLAFLTPGKH